MQILKTQDYHTIAKLNKSVHDLHVHLYPDLFKPYDQELVLSYMKEMMKNPSFIFLLALDEALGPAGYAWIEFINYPESPFNYAYSAIFIRQISVEPSKKQQGYGSALMNFITRLGKDSGANRIELDYWGANQEADRFYQKHGFIKDRIFISKRI
ncbi:hypothetical protein GCM10011351_09300 [Paraliobacillus quinghaiensis]|uniref:N-acetyltransferase domain-containing protein n=1 Tax=Paraliobacillus quinghaiensis TaxID=470815 RepID=A0A917WSI1_9BACI|nr:GNAT family N-acetyltransferase [Paraliobacillus quinghaiensis]GGM25730.1 hypothetical protein GCM10011351_09300 [Paraliobacillus quinghaiensis]